MRLSLAASALATLGLCFGFNASANAQCVTGGGGGLIPATGTGDGTWPGTLPSAPTVSTLAVTVPVGATVLNSVKLNGLTHTWAGDLQVVLQNPAGAQFNVYHRLSSVGGTVGCASDFGGDYQFFDPIAGSNPCGGGPAAMTCAATIPGGDYLQTFGDWPTGAIANTPLEQIPISNGTWTLTIYDWAGGDTGALTSFDLCFGAPTVPSGGGSVWDCVTGGAGGAFPVSGVDGTWPTVLPTGQLTSTLAVTVPAGATEITAVKLNGLNHTWLGDCQIVLTSPAGVNYNIFQEVDGVFGGGCDDPFSGDYAFVDPVVGTNECGNPAGTFLCSGVGAALPAGAYAQYYGAWTSGDAGIVNVNLSSIPLASGTWTLSIYDWFVGADNGTLTSWDLCFDSGPSAPLNYCTAGTTTNGCNASISGSAQPSASLANPCVLSVANVEGQKQGLIFYGVNNSGFTPTSWGPGSTSFLCVKSPNQRTGTQTSGGTAGLCNGSFTLDWNAYQAANPGALGNPFLAGGKVYAQAWFRDPPAPKTTNLSDALELTVQP
jgi:subtilisin-like proprotein convertase family protein